MSPAAKLSGASLATQAIADRDATIPREYLLPQSAQPLPKNRRGLLKSSGILTSKELEIVDLTVIPLAKAIADRKYSAVEVATAYCKAAAIAQQATNCLLELFQDEALQQAKQLDAHLAKTGKTVGPLHGVPISIKDHIRQAGHAAPCGFLYAIDQIAEEDAHLFKILRAAGAVAYCRTINCQAVMHLECRSGWGTTLNPWNTDLVPGGSTGGEGALLAMRGSPLGVGSDIGGSVRSPAAACGIYSFKPSIGRVPNVGAETLSAPAGYEGIISTLGPMGRSVEDLELIMRIIADACPWNYDPSLQVKPWREVKPLGRKLRIGVLRDDGVVRPVASIRRALDHALSKLKSDFEIVEFQPFQSTRSWELITKLYFPDAGKVVYDNLALAGEPADPMTDWIIAQGGGKALDRDQVIKLVADRDAYRMAVAAHWQKSGIDVLLSPVGPTPAPQPFTAKYWNYTSYWNLANYPAGVFPTGLFVEPTDVETGKPRNDQEKGIFDSYDPNVAEGAPLCLQIVGYIGHEEETLDAMKKIVAAVQK